jgi:hypothetical protein
MIISLGILSRMGNVLGGVIDKLKTQILYSAAFF